jgi:hypothetical protein
MTSDVRETYTSTEPFAPEGTMAAFAMIVPDASLSVEEVGAPLGALEVPGNTER